MRVQVLRVFEVRNQFRQLSCGGCSKWKIRDDGFVVKLFHVDAQSTEVTGQFLLTREEHRIGFQVIEGLVRHDLCWMLAGHHKTPKGVFLSEQKGGRRLWSGNRNRGRARRSFCCRAAGRAAGTCATKRIKLGTKLCSVCRPQSGVFAEHPGDQLGKTLWNAGA